MRPGQNNKQRSRGRNSNNGRRGGNPLSRNYESNGPDVKVRGTAAHVAEKYVQLARDATAAGDSVMAENYFQHAEHYFRIISASQANMPVRTDQFGMDADRDDDDDFDGDANANANQRVHDERQPRQHRPQPHVQPVSEPARAETEQPVTVAAPQGEAGETEAPARKPRVRRPRKTEAVQAETVVGEDGAAPQPDADGEAPKRARRARRPRKGEGEGEAEGAAAAPEQGALPAFLTSPPEAAAE